MQRQTTDIVVKRQRSGSPCLLPGGFRRNNNVTQVAILTRKREYIRGLIDVTVSEIVIVNRFVGDEHHCEGSLRPAHFSHQASEKAADTPRIDAMFPLPVQQIIALTLFHRYL